MKENNAMNAQQVDALEEKLVQVNRVEKCQLQFKKQWRMLEGVW